MTAALAFPVERDALEVTTTLSHVHDWWMERIARVIAPAAQPGATFWERWAAVRFLTDQFEARFRLECQLVESMAALLPPPLLAHLRAARVELERTRSRLSAAGRRRGSGPEVAVLARRFLDEARRWCAALELATTSIAADDLSDHSRELLARLPGTAVLER